MSSCRFIASDLFLLEQKTSQQYPFDINLDTGTSYDGGADDSWFLQSFKDVSEYTDKQYGAYLEWNYTDGRA